MHTLGGCWQNISVLTQPRTFSQIFCASESFGLRALSYQPLKWLSREVGPPNWPDLPTTALPTQLIRAHSHTYIIWPLFSHCLFFGVIFLYQQEGLWSRCLPICSKALVLMRPLVALFYEANFQHIDFIKSFLFKN